jgi:hypothetical protein
MQAYLLRERGSLYRALLLLLLWLQPVAADPIRYTPPPLGRIVFNEIIGPHTRAPLRLPKRGRYYAELILEPASPTTAIALSAPLALELDFIFRRHDRLLHQQALAVSFAPDERAKTLFWIEAPNTLPDRATLEVEILLRETSPTQLQPVNLRLQLTRKLELGPFLLR